MPIQMSDTSSLRRCVRRCVVVAAVATAGVSTLSLPVAGPLAVHAAPAGVSSTRSQARQPDAVADQAAQALSLAKRYQELGDPASLTSFERLLGQMAVTIAGRVALDPAEMKRAWAEADLEHQTALVAALSQLGVAYRRNTSKPGVGFDCSGLTSYAWAQAGLDLTRQSSAQIRAAAARDLDTAEVGDLVQYPGHVMMYLGVDRAVVHAVMPGRPVEVGVVKDRRNLRFGDPTG
jgi:cell wall-associated NlpC family hydrolase